VISGARLEQCDDLAPEAQQHLDTDQIEKKDTKKRKVAVRV
jgi:hypothetical protein